MRALVAKCMTISALVTAMVLIASNAEAQLNRLMSKLPARATANQAVLPNASNLAQQAVLSRAAKARTMMPRAMSGGVRQVQFGEMMPAPAAPVSDVVAPYSGEIMGSSQGSNIGGNAIGDAMMGEQGMGGEVYPSDMAFDAPPPPPNDAVVTDLLPPSAVESQMPIYSDPPAILEPVIGSGQPYDIPIADVIPQEGAETYSTNNWFRGGTWYSRQELVMLLRTDLPTVHLGVDATSRNQTVNGVNQQGIPIFLDPFISSSMSTSDGNFTYEAGTRLTLGKMVGRDVANRDHSVEFTFFGLFDFTGRASIEPGDPSNGGGITPLIGSNEVFSLQSGIAGGFPVINLVDGFNNALRQDMLYQADLNSFEVNYMVGGRPARDRLVMQPDGRWSRFATPSKVRGFYVGARYIRQNESFRFQSSGNNSSFPIFDEDPNGNLILQNGVPVPSGDTRTINVDEAGDYRVTTDNDLFGFQFGGDMVAKRTDWVFGLNGKFGGLLNFADRQSRLSQRTVRPQDPTNDPESTFVFDTESSSESMSDETLTFLGEANAYIAYYLKPNTSIRLGYNILYLNGMATATNNIGLQGGIFPKFELTGDSLYHGMNVGFETNW